MSNRSGRPRLDPDPDAHCDPSDPGFFVSLYACVLRFCRRDFREQYGTDLLATVAAREGDWAGMSFVARNGRRARELCALLRSSGGRQSSDRVIDRFSPEGSLMDNFDTDLRHSLRRLARAPSFTFVAVMTLALGIGASTAVFSLVNGILLEPLPYPDADRLVGIWHEAPGLGIEQFELSDALYYNYREGSSSFDVLSIWGNRSQTLTGGEEPVRVEGAEVTPSFFDVLQVEPALGRAFTEAEGGPEGDPVIIISSALWASRFASDPQILGRGIEASGVTREVIGVMPPGFRYPHPDTQVWTPLIIDEDRLFGHNFSYTGLGRLRQGLAPEDAVVEMNTALWGVVDRVPGQFPTELLERTGLAPILTPMKQDVVGDVGRVLWVLMGTVGLVLLIACANVANLFLVRADVSQREVAVRTALGAGPGRIRRFYLAESGVLGVLGGLAGLALAAAAIRIVVALDPGMLPRLDEVSIDGRALVFTLCVSLATAMAFGIFPAFRLRSISLAFALKDGRGAGCGRSSNAARHALVVAQVALALVLLAGSGLMARSFSALRNVDPGFEASHALSMRLSLSETDYPESADVARFILEATEHIGGLPGVIAAGTTSRIGLIGGGDMDGISVEEFPQPQNGIAYIHPVRVVSPGFFTAMGIPLVEGRMLERVDSVTGAKVAVVSEAFADNFWPEGSALGKRVHGTNDPDWYTIVGVVGSIREKDLQDPPGQTIYLPLQGHSYFRTDLSLVVRTTGNPTAILPAVRGQVWGIDPDLPISAAGTLEQLVRNSMARTTFTMAMLGIAAVVALLLGTVGVYGVVSYIVGQRTAEIGVRMALGARSGEVSTMVVRQGMVLVGFGVALGVAAAAALMRLMTSLLFVVSPLDPITFAAVSVLLSAAGTLACLLPARRAAAVDPATALRRG